METNESAPIFPDDPVLRDAAYDLPAYREYWDGKRWCVGEYQYIFGEPEVDNFLQAGNPPQGGESAQSQMGIGQVILPAEPTKRPTERGVQGTDMEQPQE